MALLSVPSGGLSIQISQDACVLCGDQVVIGKSADAAESASASRS